MRITFNVAFAALMLVIFVSMVAIASQYPYRAALMPLVVGIPGVILSLVQLITEIRKARVEAAGPAQVLGPDELPEFGAHTAREELITWGYFVAVVAGVLLFGFLVAVPILIFTYLYREVQVKAHWAVLAAAAYIGVIYFMFEVGLRFLLFRGLLTPMIMRSLGL